jgi:hypothetical protein
MAASGDNEENREGIWQPAFAESRANALEGLWQQQPFPWPSLLTLLSCQQLGWTMILLDHIMTALIGMI